MTHLPRAFDLIVGLAALALVAMGCSNERDGSATKSACVAYVSAANACWQAASGDDVLDASVCEAIDTDVDTAQVDDASACGTKDLEALYLCYASAFEDELEGLCTSLDTVGGVDVSDCVHSCDRCVVGKQRCDGEKAQYCDAASGNWKTLVTCPDNTTCKKGECLANEPEPEPEPEPQDDGDATEDNDVQEVQADAGPGDSEDDASAPEGDANTDDGATDTTSEDDANTDDGATDTTSEDDANTDDGATDTTSEDDASADDGATDTTSEDDASAQGEGADAGAEGDTAASDCTPACETKVCGDDGCGGSCGSCDDGQSCNEGSCE